MFQGKYWRKNQSLKIITDLSLFLKVKFNLEKKIAVQPRTFLEMQNKIASNGKNNLGNETEN